MDGRACALDCAKELSSNFGLNSTDGEDVLNCYMRTIAVTNHTAEGATWSVFVFCRRIVHTIRKFTIEQTVTDGEVASIVVVCITYEATIVATTTCIVAIQCARICATVNDCCVAIESAAKDTTNLSTSQLVEVLHLAVDVLDEDTAFTSDCNKSDCSACYTSRNSHGAFCCEVLDGSTCRELTEQAIVLTCSCVSDILNSVALTIECALVRSIIGTY